MPKIQQISDYSRLLQVVDDSALAELDALSEKFGEMTAYDVADVVGVLVGLKPAALIDDDKIDTDLLARLNLKYAEWQEKGLRCVSYKQEVADRLAKLHRRVWGMNSQQANENREIGELLGYPKTATEHFLERLALLESGKPLPEYTPKESADPVDIYFENLILSPEHYEQEVAAYCQPLKKATRQYTPRTYAVFCALSSRS